MSPILKFAALGIAGGVAIGTLAASSVPSTPTGTVPSEWHGTATDQSERSYTPIAENAPSYANMAPPQIENPPAAQYPADWSDAGTSARGDYADVGADPEPRAPAEDVYAPVDDRAAQAADAARQAADDARAAETLR